MKSTPSFYEWALQQGEYGKELIQSWTGIEVDKNNNIKNTNLSYDKIPKGSNKIIRFHCSNGHDWSRKIFYITERKFSCPYCKDSTARGSKSLYQWCLENDAYGQEVLSEWTGIEVDSNNNIIARNIDINNISYSKHKKMLWRCINKHHTYQQTIINKTHLRYRCPICQQGSQTSYPEQFLYHSLKQIFPDTLNRQTVLKKEYPPRGIEFDIIVPSQKLCIEYSGAHWHEQSQERDELKLNICKQRDIKFIQIVEDSHNELDHITTPEYICFRMDYQNKLNILTDVLNYILKLLNRSIYDIDLQQADKDALSVSNKNNAILLKDEYHNVFKDVHKILNNNLEINKLKLWNSPSIYWECPKCHYGKNGEWRNTASNRVYFNQACPNCGYNSTLE